MATVTSVAPPPQDTRTRPSAARVRKPFRDNPRLILAGILVLVAALVGILMLANGSSRYSPDFLSEFVLYGLTAADLTMLVALVFVLARNIVKLVVERRRGRPGHGSRSCGSPRPGPGRRRRTAPRRRAGRSCGASDAAA